MLAGINGLSKQVEEWLLAWLHFLLISQPDSWRGYHSSIEYFHIWRYFDTELLQRINFIRIFNLFHQFADLSFTVIGWLDGGLRYLFPFIFIKIIRDASHQAQLRYHIRFLSLNYLIYTFFLFSSITSNGCFGFYIFILYFCK